MVEALAAKRMARSVKTPKAMHHVGYVTNDVDATRRFYGDILGLELIRTVIDDHVPSTGDPYPYIHLFFKLGDGSNLAFFECLDLPAASKASHPAYEIFNHIALDVESAEEVDRWADHLKANGVAVVGPYNHGSIYSVYFRDPNGIRLECTTSLNWIEDPQKAAREASEWMQQKAESIAVGNSAPLTAWIEKNRKQSVE